jgi:Transmembrane domain of unknown function (DUF3566)
MTERPEQAPVQTRTDAPDDHQDTARIPLAERLQRRISAAAQERQASGQSSRESASGSARVLPPMPPDLRGEPTGRANDSGRDSGPNTGPIPGNVSRPEARAVPVGEPRGRAVQPVPGPTDGEPTQPVPAAPARRPAATTRRTPSRAPRRARLRLSRIDPWSVMKVSFLLSIAFGIVTVVSVFMVWSVLGAAGVWTSINNTVSDTVSSGTNTSTFNIEDYLGMSRVLGFTMLVSVIDVILITAIATLGAFLYNMAASLLGGIEVTLAEDR